MKNTIKLFGIIVLMAVIGFSAVSCKEDAVKNNNAPTLTDIKFTANTANPLNGPYTTTLTRGNTYSILIFAADQDLDITKCVVTDSSGSSEFPLTLQGAVSETFIGSLPIPADMPPTSGQVEFYVQDSKGNKSNKITKTLTIN